MIKNKKIILVISIITIILMMLSTSSNAAASAKAFGNGQSGYAESCAGYAVYGFDKLGYSATYLAGPITRDDMLSWINNTGNGYGMYVHTFGGDGYFNDYNGYSITSSMISGFIDSGNSAVSTSLASAFHTIGYTNRCFLGWNGAVTTANAELFNYYFWTEYVGSATIQSGAISAASNVPGAGTTPIRLYGSTSYYGWAR